MSEKKKQEYTTGGLKNRQDVENALASAEYRPSQEVTDAASDLKQWQANRPGDYESAYQGRIDGLMENLLDRKEFSYSYGADPLYRQYAQLYTQNAQNASADAAAQAAALTGGYGSSYAASAARQAYQQQIGALSEAIPTLYRLALDTYQSGGDALVEQIDQLNGQEQNAQQKYERELADYYTQLEQKGNAYNTAYTQDYGRYQDYLGQLDSLYGYYAAQEQQEAARRQQGFNNVMTVLGLLGDAAQLAITMRTVCAAAAITTMITMTMTTMMRTSTSITTTTKRMTTRSTAATTITTMRMTMTMMSMSIITTMRTATAAAAITTTITTTTMPTRCSPAGVSRRPRSSARQTSSMH